MRKYLLLFLFFLVGSLISCNNNTDGKSAAFECTLCDDQPSQKNKEEKTETAKQKKIIKDSLAIIEKKQEEKEVKARTYEARPFTKMVLEDYFKNEVTAEAKYAGQVYYIKGEIAGISKTMAGEIFFNIGMGHPYQNIQCFVDNASEINTIETGQHITTKGEFLSIYVEGQVITNVKMQHCKIIND